MQQACKRQFPRDSGRALWGGCAARQEQVFSRILVIVHSFVIILWEVQKHIVHFTVGVCRQQGFTIGSKREVFLRHLCAVHLARHWIDVTCNDATLFTDERHMTTGVITIGVFIKIGLVGVNVCVACLVVLVGDIGRVCLFIIENVVRELGFDKRKAAPLKEGLHGGEVIYNVNKLHRSDKGGIGLLLSCGCEAHIPRHERTKYR